MLKRLRHNIPVSARLLLVLTLLQCLFVAFEIGAETPGNENDHHHLRQVTQAPQAESSCVSSDCSADVTTTIKTSPQIPHTDNCDHCCQCLGHAHCSHFAVLPTNQLLFLERSPAVLLPVHIAFSPNHLDAIHRPPIV